MPELADLPRTPLSMSTPVAMTTVVEPSVTLQNFTMPPQQEEYWCWAAVSISMRSFYGRNGNGLTQCQLAGSVLNRSDCCEGGACDIPAELDTALKCADVSVERFPGSLDAQNITYQLNNNRPIGVRIAWDVANAHFVAVFGIFPDSSGQMWVDVGDPDPSVLFGTTPLSALTSRYRGQGVWTHSYVTA